MKKFTLKDYLNYFPKCFSCDKDNKAHIEIDSTFRVQPIISSVSMLIEFVISYKDSLKLEIIALNNSYATENVEGLRKYVQGKEIQIVIGCSMCRTYVRCKPIQLDFSRNILVPLELLEEYVVVKDQRHTFYVLTKFANTDLKSDLEIFSKRPDGQLIKEVSLQINQYPIYRFRTKDRFVKKMQTYLNYQ